MVSPITCPICKKVLPATDVRDSKFFPFCTERCRNVDLLRWSKGQYAIVEPLNSDQLEMALIDTEGLEDELS